MFLSLNDPDTLLVWLYTVLDAFFGQTELPFYTDRFSNNQVVPFSDAELFTTAIFPVLMGYSEKKLGYHYLCRHYRQWFPLLPTYEAWNRRLNRNVEAWQYLYTLVLLKFAPPQRVHEFVVDTLPITVCQAQHAAKSKAAQPFVSKGYCRAKKKYYVGVKVQLLAGFEGPGLPTPRSYIVETAKDHDLPIAKDSLCDVCGVTIYGDKAYCDRGFQLELFAQDTDLIVPLKKKKGAPPLGLFDQAYNSLHASKRQPIESLTAWIQSKTRIQEASKVRSVNGLFSHIAVKMVAALFMFLLDF